MGEEVEEKVKKHINKTEPQLGISQTQDVFVNLEPETFETYF